MFKAAETPDIAAPLKPKPNWPLIIGGAMALLILALAIFGPTLAPQDPREKKLVIQVNGKWLVPPYPAFTPGFPLGSDDLGRDLFSWLLWSVRPTLLLVVVVAALRMILGLLIGVGAGWSDRRAGRLFDGLITAALAVPTLLAALIVITAVGFRVGVWAFVIGLAITGWAETAQLVREQTRTIRAQDAIEAAVALGASGGQILFLHIVPQVMPMLWMLLAFEISNTLVTTAGLGFLGYYLGGAVFTEVSDFVYQRISEMPELGQMLATAWMVLDEPWAMVAAGTLVFVIVLAFNLIGEGLQQRLTRHLGGSRALYTRLAGDVLPWFDERLTQPLTALTQRRAFRPLAALLLIAALGGGALWWRAAHAPAAMPTPEVVATATPGAPGAALVTPGNHVAIGMAEVSAPRTVEQTAIVEKLLTPGGHLWAAERGNPWETLWSNTVGPQRTETAWIFEAEDGLSGGPAVAADGALYVAVTGPGRLYALDSSGETLWQTALVTSAVGAPALDVQGNIYVVDFDGGLTAFASAGQQLWRWLPENVGRGYTGPIVAPDGVAYYGFTRSGKIIIQAVSAGGSGLWEAEFPFTPNRYPPALSPAGNWLFWENFVVSARDGAALPDPLGGAGPALAYFTGANGVAYARSGDIFRPLVETETGIAPSGLSIQWLFVKQERRQVDLTRDGGVTPDNIGWLSGDLTWEVGARAIWGRVDSEAISEVVGDARARTLYRPIAIAVDRNATLYVCGNQGARCCALSPTAATPVWELTFTDGERAVGGALAAGRLYIATTHGRLLALGK